MTVHEFGKENKKTVVLIPAIITQCPLTLKRDAEELNTGIPATDGEQR